jgi:4-oxalocrotonate tautomerase
VGASPTRKWVTVEEKAALITGAGQLLLNALRKHLDSTFVVIEEIETESWGGGGLPVLEYRKRQMSIKPSAASMSTATRPSFGCCAMYWA